MERINIDIETRCMKDLTKVGVYAYADDPSLSVLLFGYAIDGGPVNVIDLARGGKIPKDVMNALTDDSVLKWAFNAQFERVCIGKMLGTTLSHDSWRCTMVAGLYLGLPGSLTQVGSVFNFEKQKLKSGSDLIKIFSVPHYKKGSKEPYFIEPDDEPEKYEEFIRYNCRDVETEMEIYDKVSRFLVPEDVWQQYALDQRINDTGIKLDIPFVEKAIECDGIYSKKYLDRAQQLTGLGYLFGYPNADRGPAELLSYSIFSASVDPFESCHSDAVFTGISGKRDPLFFYSDGWNTISYHGRS